jgi:hypothetical protein
LSHLQFIYTILFPINGQFLTNSPLIISLPYGSWIYHYLCNQCLPPLKLWVRTPLRRGVFDRTLCDSFSTTCTRSVIFSGFFTNKTLPPPHSWNIVESGVKHHNFKFEYESSCLQTLHCIFLITLRYNWNIVESGVKHHDINLHPQLTAPLTHIYAQNINNTWHIWYIPLIAAQIKTDIRVIIW